MTDKVFFDPEIHLPIEVRIPLSRDEDDQLVAVSRFYNSHQDSVSFMVTPESPLSHRGKGFTIYEVTHKSADLVQKEAARQLLHLLMSRNSLVV